MLFIAEIACTAGHIQNKSDTYIWANINKYHAIKIKLGSCDGSYFTLHDGTLLWEYLNDWWNKDAFSVATLMTEKLYTLVVALLTPHLRALYVTEPEEESFTPG